MAAGPSSILARMTDIVVSYDGSSTDDDGLALGKMLSRTGASLSLAYVRHSREFDPKREELAQHDAERRLQHGHDLIGAEGAPQHIIINPSTPEGLRQLAASEAARSSPSAPTTGPHRAAPNLAQPRSGCSRAGRSRSPSPPPACA